MPDGETGKSSTADDAGAERLEALVARAEPASDRQGLPPVEKWNPRLCGEIDMEIPADGTWFYMGTPIGRAPLVGCFRPCCARTRTAGPISSRRSRRSASRIEDAPFVAVEMDAREEGGEQVLTFRTNVGDVVEAGADHPIRFVTAKGNDGVKPYVLVRGRLEALMSRPVMYELIAQGEEIEVDGETMFAVRSRGAVFPVMPAGELERLAGEA